METAKLFIGNLPFSATEDDIKTLFSEVGTVEEVRLINDRETGRSKGFGFITFAEEQMAKAAIEKFNGHEFQGRPLRVDRAVAKSGGGGGGGRGRGERTRY